VQVYFELSHEDTIHSSNGSNHIVPIQWTTLSGSDGTPQLSHDCGTFGELNHVIDDMISDLEKLRKKGEETLRGLGESLVPRAGFSHLGRCVTRFQIS
jgi:hypothetical protein